MAITNNCKGVWVLDDTYKKINSDLWINYVSVYDVNAPGTLWSWGPKYDGLGDGTNGGGSCSGCFLSPVQIPGNNWLNIAAGCQSSYFTKDNYTLWAVGLNTAGRLGTNNTTDYSSPVQIPGSSWCTVNTESADVGNENTIATLALKTDGTLWAWGYGMAGQLGINSTVNYSSPIQVPGTTWSNISKNPCVSMAIKTDGTLWAWGVGTAGRLGLNSVVSYSSPVQIPGTQWNSVRVGCSYTFATKTDNTLWAWGCCLNGVLGINSVTNRSSPTQIPGTWYNVSKGSFYHILATKTDGTMWGWGFNSGGELGLDDKVHRSSPTQIPGSNWVKVSTGHSYSHAIKSDGTLWGWGDQQYAGGKTGFIGDGTGLSKYSSPIQIPGLWYNIDSSWTRVVARKA